MTSTALEGMQESTMAAASTKQPHLFLQLLMQYQMQLVMQILQTTTTMALPEKPKLTSTLPTADSKTTLMSRSKTLLVEQQERR